MILSLGYEVEERSNGQSFAEKVGTLPFLGKNEHKTGSTVSLTHCAWYEREKPWPNKDNFFKSPLGRTEWVKERLKQAEGGDKAEAKGEAEMVTKQITK